MEAVAFEDTFATLNTTRWDPSTMSGARLSQQGGSATPAPPAPPRLPSPAEADGPPRRSLAHSQHAPLLRAGQDHCQGLAPAGPSTCTQMLPQMVMINKTFSTINPLILGTGLALRASQQPCSTVKGSTSPSQCCSGATCAAWAGAHLMSNGCVLYGVLELEAAFDMTKPNAAGRTSGAFYFTATYMVKSADPSFDPAWNEIDVGMIEGARGLELHLTAFTANDTSPTVTTMDALSFDASGPINPTATCGLGTPGNAPCGPKNSDGSSAGSSVPGSVHAAGSVNHGATFTNSINFHTYKVLWTPQWTAWMVGASFLLAPALSSLLTPSAHIFQTPPCTATSPSPSGAPSPSARSCAQTWATPPTPLPPPPSAPGAPTPPATAAPWAACSA